MKKVTFGPQTLLYPMPAVLVGAEVEGKANFMTAAWCGIAASSPPALAVGNGRRGVSRGEGKIDGNRMRLAPSPLKADPDHPASYSL